MGANTTNTSTNSGTGTFSPWAQNIQNNMANTLANPNQPITNFFDVFNGTTTTTKPTTGTSTGTYGGTTTPNPATANLGSKLDPKFYDPAIAAQLPANLPGGGGGVVNSYGIAPWGNAQYGMAAGANPYVDWSGGNNYFNTPAGMYNPYLGQSSVMGVPGAVNNPYGGFNSSINSYASGVDNYLNNIRAPQYSTPEPTTDTSPGSPFAGQQVVHGNTPGWQSAGGDYVGTPQESYQATPGTQVDQGIANPMQQANTLGRRALMRQQMMHRWQDSPYFQRNRMTPYSRPNFWGR